MGGPVAGRGRSRAPTRPDGVDSAVAAVGGVLAIAGAAAGGGRANRGNGSTGVVGAVAVRGSGVHGGGGVVWCGVEEVYYIMID